LHGKRRAPSRLVTARYRYHQARPAALLPPHAASAPADRQLQDVEG